MKRIGALRSALFSCLPALLMLASCTGKPPEIGQVDLRPIYVQDPQTGAIEVRLRLYLQASDPDGNDDLAAAYLIDDAKEIFWEVRADSWQAAPGGWVGTYSLALPRGWKLPAGTYRIVLEDAAGETAERSVRVEAVAASLLRFPRARKVGDRIEVEPPGAWIWAYAPGGELLVAGPPASVPWQRVARYYVYSSDNARRIGLLSGPYEP